MFRQECERKKVNTIREEVKSKSKGNKIYRTLQCAMSVIRILNNVFNIWTNPFSGLTDY